MATRLIRERIASWFEGMSMFYDLADPSYKNTQFRDMKLKDFSKEINIYGKLFI